MYHSDQLHHVESDGIQNYQIGANKENNPLCNQPMTQNSYLNTIQSKHTPNQNSFIRHKNLKPITQNSYLNSIIQYDRNIKHTKIPPIKLRRSSRRKSKNKKIRCSKFF